MALGACRLNRHILVLVIAVWACLGFISCGGSTKKNPPSGLKERVLASQGVSSTSAAGALVILNAQNDTIARVSRIPAGNSPGFMAVTPSLDVAAAFDSSSNTVFAVNTTTEAAIGSGVKLHAAATSMVLPTANQIGYAAVPGATISGFNVNGDIEVMSFAGSGLTTSIAVDKAQTVISNDGGSQLLVFSNDSDSVTILSPSVAVPPVDTSCLTNPPNAVCTVVPGFDRPVYGIISGSTAYILNCGPQCGGIQASVAVFDLPSLSITSTIPVDAATYALLDGTTLYVAGTPITNNACTGQTTAATICGRLDVVDLGAGTVTGSAVIADGYHTHMDKTANGQIFIGSLRCTSVGNVNNPSGEVRGCLSIYKIADGSVLMPPDNGDVNGLQGFVTRNIEYVAEGGILRVYDTTKDILLINDFVPQGSIDVVGYVGDVKAIDLF